MDARNAAGVPMAYQPIESYGVIGAMRTAAFAPTLSSASRSTVTGARPDPDGLGFVAIRARGEPIDTAEIFSPSARRRVVATARKMEARHSDFEYC